MLPFVYIAAVGAGFIASYIAVVQQIGEVSSGGYFLIFWMFQNPPDLFYSLIKGMSMATLVVLVGATTATRPAADPSGSAPRPPSRWWPTGRACTSIGMLGTQVFWGTNPRAPIGG